MSKIARLIRRKILCGSSRGATLVEVLIAIAVLGLITSSIMPVLLMLNKAEFKWTEQTVSESLIRTQVEYIKGCPYIYGNVSVPEPPYATVPTPDPSYEIEVFARPVLIDPATQQHTYLPSGQDEGIQEIEITVKHVDREIISATNYKVDRP
jgi:type II secretory pathway pseudopilin PulG